MPIRHAGRVCLLSEGEAAELKDGIQPKCHLHKHITSEDAFDMTAPLWQKRDLVSDSPVAKWVGPTHIQITDYFTWRTVRSSFDSKQGGKMRITTKQLVAA